MTKLKCVDWECRREGKRSVGFEQLEPCLPENEAEVKAVQIFSGRKVGGFEQVWSR